MLLLASLWVASLFVVNPIGDFPLNDDWSFGLAVKNLLQTGEFHPTGWTSMPLITQTLWGALFCLPGGFSFNALRFSTLAIIVVQPSDGLSPGKASPPVAAIGRYCCADRGLQPHLFRAVQHLHDGRALHRLHAGGGLFLLPLPAGWFGGSPCCAVWPARWRRPYAGNSGWRCQWPLRSACFGIAGWRADG